MKVFDTTLARLERALDVRLVRQNVLSTNVANVDTPGFRPKDVDFTASMVAIEGAAHSEGGVSQPTSPTVGSSAAESSSLAVRELPIVDVPAGGSADAARRHGDPCRV